MKQVVTRLLAALLLAMLGVGCHTRTVSTRNSSENVVYGIDSTNRSSYRNGGKPVYYRSATRQDDRERRDYERKLREQREHERKVRERHRKELNERAEARRKNSGEKKIYNPVPGMEKSNTKYQDIDMNELKSSMGLNKSGGGGGKSGSSGGGTYSGNAATSGKSAPPSDRKPPTR